MYEYRAPSADMLFVLFDVFEVDTLWQTLSGMGDVDQETARAILEEAAKLCNEVIAPLNRVGDEQGSVLTDEGDDIGVRRLFDRDRRRGSLSRAQ